MKHSPLKNNPYNSIKKTHAILAIILSGFFAMPGCRKQQIPEPANARQIQQATSTKNYNMMLESISLNDSVIKMKCQNNLKQLIIAVHNYDDGTFKKEMAYEYDSQGRLIIGVENATWRSSFQHDRFGKIVKAGVYKGENLFPDFTIDFEYNATSDLANWRANYGTGGNTAPGSSGTDILIAGTGYDYYPDGTIRSILIYADKDYKVPIGKVLFFNNATSTQVAAWKEIAGRFPEPEKPWEILTMLCNRIEMYGYGTVANEDLVDGKIFTAKNFVFSEEGYLLSKEVSNNIDGLVSTGSTQTSLSSNSFGVEYKYVPVRR